MSDSNFKTLRKQLRNVVQQELEGILKTELTSSIKKQLSEELGKRMDVIAEGAKETLQKIQENQKKFQSYLIRQIASQQPVTELSPLPNLENEKSEEKIQD